MIQRSMFHETIYDQYEREGFDYNSPRLEDVTFKNGLDEPAHGWFRLTPSYSPELVRHLFETLDCRGSTKVLDPFIGKGTTSIEGKRQGIPTIGVEINPVLQLASKYSLSWNVEPGDVASSLDRVIEHCTSEIERASNYSIEDYSFSEDLKIPRIYNVYRWWRERVLKELLILRRHVLAEQDPVISQLFWVALTDASLECANIHRNHPTITFDDNHTRVIEPLGTFSTKVERIITDLASLPQNDATVSASILLGDSTRISEYVSEPITRLITSPPYPNRFSYVHQTRPQLFFMGLVDSAGDATEIDLGSIGGTWGRATSNLQRSIVEPKQDIADILAPIVKELRPRHNLLCNYAVKYFNMIDDHIEDLATVVGEGFRGAYVVGNSRLSGVDVFTDIILARIFEGRGFRVDKMLLLRKRGGRKRLHETAVCISSSRAT